MSRARAIHCAKPGLSVVSTASATLGARAKIIWHFAAELCHFDPGNDYDVTIRRVANSKSDRVMGPGRRSPSGRGGGRASAALALLDDLTTSPASRPLASAIPALAPKRQLIYARLTVVWALLKQSSVAWLQDNAPSMGAALTFYAILSLAPALIVATAIAGLGFWQQVAEAEVLRQIQAVVGETSARALQTGILSANRPSLGAIASTIGIGTMLIGASGAFVELQDALNKIWGVGRKSGSILLSAIRQRLLSFSLVVGTGVLLLLSLVLSAGLVALERFMGHLLPCPIFILQSVDFLFSFGVITLLLAAVFRLLPDTKIAWNDVWIGAAIASLLFTTGKVLIGLYLGGSAVASPYGAMSSSLVVLVWIYYSAQIVLFGAEITHVYANKHGTGDEDSVWPRKRQPERGGRGKVTRTRSRQMASQRNG